MKYEAFIKIQVVNKNTRIPHDGFGSWSVTNTGKTTLYIAGLIPIAPGDTFNVDLQPYVTYADDILINFDENGTNNAILKLIYCNKK